MTRTRAGRAMWVATSAFVLAGCGPGSVPVDGGDAASDRGDDTVDGERADAASDSPTEATDLRADGYGANGPCMPGVPRCNGDFGYEVCEQDGTWSASHSCAGYSMNGTSSYCAEIPTTGGGTYATCVDPACWYWVGRGALGGAVTVGVCGADGSMQACTAGGTLAPTTCGGVCTRVATLDGRALGYCAPECEDGARECLGGPFYRTCAHGRWTDTPSTCDGACNPVATGARPDIRCGGACEPDTSRCRADLGAIETCVAVTPDGGADAATGSDADTGVTTAWTLDRTCLLGQCRPAGPQAECETECAPGEHACAFDGAPAERSCGATGLWMPESACDAGTTCRLNGDVARGCVACASGGNAYGSGDSRCVDAGVETCGSDGSWQAATPCTAGKTCTSIARGVSTLAACETL